MASIHVLKPSRPAGAALSRVLTPTAAAWVIPASQSRTEARLKPPHPAQPALDVLRLPPDVLSDRRVREDEEALRRQPLDHRVGDTLRLEHTVDPRDTAARNAVGHGGAHCLRAEDRHLEPGVAVGDGEPLREGD